MKLEPLNDTTEPENFNPNGRLLQGDFKDSTVISNVTADKHPVNIKGEENSLFFYRFWSEDASMYPSFFFSLA